MSATIIDIPFDVLFELKKYLDLISLTRLKSTCYHFSEWGKLNDSKIAPCFTEIALITGQSSIPNYIVNKNIKPIDWQFLLSFFPFSYNFCQCTIRINLLKIFCVEKSEWKTINYCNKHNNFILSEAPLIRFIQVFQSKGELLSFIQSHGQKIRLATKEFRYYGWQDYTMNKISDFYYQLEFNGYRSSHYDFRINPFL